MGSPRRDRRNAGPGLLVIGDLQAPAHRRPVFHHIRTGHFLTGDESHNSVTGFPSPVCTLCRLTSGNRQPCRLAALERWSSNSVAVPATTSRYSPPVTARPPSASTVTPPRSLAPAKQYGHVPRPPGHPGRRRWLDLDVDDVEATLVAVEARDVQRLQPRAEADLKPPLSWPYREERVEPSAGKERQRQIEDPVLRVRVGRGDGVPPGIGGRDGDGSPCGGEHPAVHRPPPPGLTSSLPRGSSRQMA